ncbi:MAG: stage V sporulation protein B, partial [Halanaerobium sp.]
AYAYQITTFITVAAAALFYFVVLLLLQEIKYQDLAVIPVFGEKLANLLKRWSFLKD